MVNQIEERELTWEGFLKELGELIEKDGCKNKNVRVGDVLDYSGRIGVPGAQDLYNGLLEEDGDK